ncbi:MAG: hypothetical protein ACK47B_05940 [Armatimonadota bacterium]
MAEARATVDAVERDLTAGRIPRARQRLTEAARVLKKAACLSDASRAYRVLAELERRRGEMPSAVAAARLALRVVRHEPESGSAEAALALLAQLHCDASDAGAALKHASQCLQQAEARGERAGIAAALQLQAAAYLAARSYGLAVQHAAAAVAAEDGTQAELCSRGRRLLALALLQAGCPVAAVRELSPLLPRREATAADIPALTARGFAHLTVGNVAAGARDLRKAARLTRQCEDRRREAQTLAAHALAEMMLARDTDRPKRAAAAERLAARATRLAQRVRDPRTLSAVEWMVAAMHRNPSPFEGLPVRETARGLVKQAHEAECLTLTGACLAEVERLQQFREEQLIRRCAFVPPLCLE